MPLYKHNISRYVRWIILTSLLFSPRLFAQEAPLVKKNPTIRLSSARDVNVIDNALIQLANTYLKMNRIEDAIATLERIIEESPLQDMKGLAHFYIGRIYSEILNDREKSRQHFARVSGRYAPSARLRVITKMEMAKKYQEAIDFLALCARVGATPKEKSESILRMITTAHKAKDNELMQRTLMSVSELISYDDAIAAAKIAAEENKKRDEEYKKRYSNKHPTLKTPNVTAPKEPPPPVGKKTNVQNSAQLEKRIEILKTQIRKLEENGFKDRANRLRKTLEALRDEAEGQF